MNGGGVDMLAVQVDGCTAKNRQTGLKQETREVRANMNLVS